MNQWRPHSADETRFSTHSGRFLVPQDRMALLIQNGTPERFYPPGQHELPRGKVEVRLLPHGTAKAPVLAPPGRSALALPFERSLLHVDGDLVGILQPSRTEVDDTATIIGAWEGFHPDRESLDQAAASPWTCITEPLRVCIPAAGTCCGARRAA